MTYGLYYKNNLDEHIKIVKVNSTADSLLDFKIVKEYFMSIKNLKEDKFDNLFEIKVIK